VGECVGSVEGWRVGGESVEGWRVRVCDEGELREGESVEGVGVVEMCGRECEECAE
jgi:hypothetical protein